MKTRAQKQEELKKGKELLEKSKTLVFIDFTKVPAGELIKLRRDLKAAGAKLLVIKKRLLDIVLKEKKIDIDLKQHKISLGAIFSEGDIEKVSGPTFKFFSSLDIPEGETKGVWIKHILSGYDVVKKEVIDAEKIVFIGNLPPREVLLAQLLGMFVAPLRGFMYILDQKAKATKDK